MRCVYIYKRKIRVAKSSIYIRGNLSYMYTYFRPCTRHVTIRWGEKGRKNIKKKQGGNISKRFKNTSKKKKTDIEQTHKRNGYIYIYIHVIFFYVYAHLVCARVTPFADDKINVCSQSEIIL